MDHNEDQEEYFEDENPFEKRRGYKVGYGKPPRQHRFKPGNKAAAGKRKRCAKTNARQLLYQIMNEKVTVVINGKRTRMTQREACMRFLISESKKSDKTMMQVLLLLMEIESEDFVGVQDSTITVEFVHTRPIGLPGSEFVQPQQPKLGKWKPQPD